MAMRRYGGGRARSLLRGFLLGMLLTTLAVFALLWFLPGQLQSWLDTLQAMLGKG
jgi:hypothetical protein